MALNTGGFRLNVMPVAPTGIENLGKFNVAQVLEASRMGAENVEQAFNTPFRIAQEAAKTKTAQANQRITETKAATLPEETAVDIEGKREATKSKILANQLSAATLEADTRLAKTRSDILDLEKAYRTETDPTRAAQLRSQADSLASIAETQKLQLEAAKQNQLFQLAAQNQAEEAKLTAETLPLRRKILQEFEAGGGAREVAPGVTERIGLSGATSTTVNPLAAAASTPSGGLTPVINPVTGLQAIDPNGNPLFQRPEVVGKSLRMSKPFAVGASDVEVSEDNPMFGFKDYVVPFSSDRSARNVETAAFTKATSDLSKRIAGYKKLRADAMKFAELNAQEDTGPIQGYAQKGTGLIGTSDKTKEMAALEATMNAFSDALKGQGTISDHEREMLRRALPSITKARKSNEAFYEYAKRQAEEAEKKQAFLNSWRRNDMGQLAGAEQAWNEYVTDVPDLSTPIDTWISNKNTRQSYDAAVTATGTPGPIGDTQAAAAPAVTPAKKTSGRFTIEAIE